MSEIKLNIPEDKKSEFEAMAECKFMNLITAAMATNELTLEQERKCLEQILETIKDKKPEPPTLDYNSENIPSFDLDYDGEPEGFYYLGDGVYADVGQ